MKITSGRHLGVVREWIKWNARNGSDVMWASHDTLRLKPLTVNDLEQLAQGIHDACLQQFKHLLKTPVCDHFRANVDDDDDVRMWNFCKHCGNHKDLHLTSDEG